MRKVANIVGISLILLAFASMLKKPEPPGPGPGPVKGLRIVFVWESSKGFPTKEMSVAWNSLKVDEWMEANVEGGREGFRRWDKDVDVSKETPIWRGIWSAAKPQLGELPQILVVGHDKKEPQAGKFYPFPKNGIDDLMKFLDTAKAGKLK